MQQLLEILNRTLGPCLAALSLLLWTAEVRPINGQDRIRRAVPMQRVRVRDNVLLAAPAAMNPQPMVDQIRRQLEPMLKVELSFVNRAAKLNDDERQALVAASLKWFDTFAADFVNKQDPNEQQMWLQGMRGIRIGGDRSTADPRESIERGVAQVVASTLSKEKVTTYESECAARMKFYREVAVANVVECADEQLNLSSLQRLEITKSLLENWEKDLEPQLEFFVVKADALPDAAEMWIRPALSDSQRRMLNRMNKLRTQEIFFGQIGGGPDNEVIDDIDLNVQLPVAADEPGN
jgi:hypothetical protein